MLAIQIYQRSCKLLPLSEKVENSPLNKKEKKLYAEVAEIDGKNKSSIRETA